MLTFITNMTAFLAFIFTEGFEGKVTQQLNNQKDNDTFFFLAFEISSNRNLISSLLLDSKTLIFDIYIAPA